MFQDKEADTVTVKAQDEGNMIMANFRNMIKKNPLIAKLRSPGKMPGIIAPKRHEITFRKAHAHGKHEAAIYGRLVAVCHANNDVRLHHVEEGLNKVFSHTELIHLARNGQTRRVRLQFSENKMVSVCRGDLKHFLVTAGLLNQSPATA
jgi:hypothetical protein